LHAPILHPATDIVGWHQPEAHTSDIRRVASLAVFVNSIGPDQVSMVMALSLQSDSVNVVS